MAKPAHPTRLSEADWRKKIHKQWPDTAVPGYWHTLEENCAQWSNDISVCPFWTEASKSLRQWTTEYRRETRGALLAKPGLPKFEGKREKRIFDKLYQELLRNDDFKYEVFPKDGPPIPRLNDLVRTRISCQYVDGVEFLANKLTQLADSMGLNPEREKQGRLEGYFAQHVNFKGHVYYRFGGGNEPAIITCEIQLATELSTRIWEGTHAIYEHTRVRDEDPAEWQWNPKDPRFVSRQLGHMIHLADGLLVQLREAATSEKEERS